MFITPITAVFYLFLVLIFILFSKKLLYIRYLCIVSAFFVILHASISLNFRYKLIFMNPNKLSNIIFYFSFEKFFIMDNISVLMYFLTTLIFFICFYYIAQNQFYLKIWYILLLSLEIILILAFTTNNLFLFVLFFEMIIIPMFIIIFLFGSRGRRVHASYYFFFYTLSSSIFLFFGLFFVYNIYESFDYFFIHNSPILITNSYIAILFFLGFAAKIPICPLHIWLPEAHVESPTIGSVILASLLLKLGLYGLLRIVYLFPESCISIRSLVWTFGLISILYATMAALRSIDIKKIIAYSSIVHMNLAVLALFSCNSLGIYACILSMYAHAFTSAGLFLCAGFLYDRIKTRNILYMSGQEISTMRWFKRLFFFFIISNMGAPFTCNFIAELLCYLAIGQINWLVAFFVIFILLVLSILFNLLLLYNILYSQSIYFKYLNINIDDLKDLNRTEIICLLYLFFFILLFGINPEVIGYSFLFL